MMRPWITVETALPFTVVLSIFLTLGAAFIQRRKIRDGSIIACVWVAFAAAGFMDTMAVCLTGQFGPVTGLRAIWYSLVAVVGIAGALRFFGRTVLR